MTLEEVQKVARIIGTADSGCSVCVGALTRRLQQQFPEFTWSAGDTTISEQWDETGKPVGPDDDWQTYESFIPVIVKVSE